MEQSHSDTIRYTVQYFNYLPTIVSASYPVHTISRNEPPPDPRCVVHQQGVANPVIEIVTTADAVNNSGEGIPLDKLDGNNATNTRGTHMIIHSERLSQTIRDVVKFYAGQNLTGKSLIIREPYACLMHHMSDLEDLVASDKDCINSGHVQILLEFLRPRYLQYYIPAKERSLAIQPTVIFDDVWVLMKPGSLAYTVWDGHKIGCVIHKITRLPPKSSHDLPERWSIEFWFLQVHWPSDQIGCTTQSAIVDRFDGEKLITSLPIHPVEFLDGDDQGRTKQRFIDRGRKVLEVLSGELKQMEYDGECMDHSRQSYTGRIVVGGADGIEELYPKNNWQFSWVSPSQMMKKDPDVPLSQIELMVNPKKDSQDVLTVDHLFILSPCLSALELSRNDWVLITVENIRPLTEYHNSPLPILDEAKLELIQAVVDITHGRHAPRTLLSQNEPNGSIIHIHGPPSVGKSSMIECIALRSRRPLLTLSPAEVGITYHSIRVNLRRWLSIGKRLKAVVLIANCDLIIRDPRIADSDLIIAFIQALKLYEGVIFLTTSKIDDIDDIDDALRPLVSLSISVPRINGKARSSIWAALENRIMAEEGIKLHQSAIKFLRFSGIHVSNWDVHEITRCYKIAIALAKKRTTQEQESTITVEDSHFKEAMNVVHESRRNFDERFPPPSRHHEMRSLPVSTLHEDVRGYAAVMAAPRVPKHPFIHSPMPPPMPPPTHPPTRPPTHHHPTHHHPTHHSTHHPIPHSPMSEPETNHGTSSSEASEQTLDNDSDLCIPHLNRIEWNAFSAAGTKELFRNATFYAMDVLEGEPLIKLHVDNRRQRKRQSFTHQTVSLDSIIPNATDHVRRVPNLLKPGKATLPERIRINAPAIIKAFSDICGEEISGPFLLFRPFRSLLYYEEEFHDLIRQQETLIQERPAQDIHTEEEDVENETKRRNALAGLEQLKCLVSFIDDILKKKQEYLKSDDCQFVPFDDVAMLFSPGETVISNDRKQVYLVMRVSCTRHRVKGQNENTPLCFLKDEGSVELDDDPIFVHCIYLDFDGKMIGPAHRTFTIFRYEDEREISSFPVFPLQHVKEDGLRERFIKRGKMFFEVAGIKHMHYTGLSLKTRDDIDSQVVIDFEEAINRHPQWKPMITSVLEQPLEKMAASVLDAYPGKAANGIVPNSNANAQVFSDAFSNAQKSMKRPCILQCCAGELKHHDEYIEDRRGEDCIVSQMNRTTPTRLPVTIVPQEFCNIVENNSLTDDEYLIMSYRVFGFVLHSRKWHELDMTHVFEVAVLGAGEGFDELVLPPGHGDMVKSMIRQHLRDRTLSSINRDKADVVRGKGRGLIILLHGVPGVGKTSTAECVADLFRRPLFQITSGDLGITAKEVEDALEENFSLASRWNSILLIDEADVFLAERTKEDFVRNSLVAVFLRMMEYYAGVLFLTTNRVGVFDEAFTSRIHISLYYPPLDRKSTLQIFQKNWDRINTRYKEAGRVIDIDTSDITEFAIDYFENNKEGRWNGRQIRNAFQSALALAELDALGTDDVLNESEHNKPVNLGRKSFDTVAEAYKGFTSYLKQVYGADFARRARENLWRFDAFGFPRMPNNLNTRLKVAEPIIPPHQGQWPGQGFPGYDPRNPQPYYPPRQHYPDSYDYSGQRPADPPPSTAHQYPDPRDRWGARPSTGDSNQ